MIWPVPVRRDAPRFWRDALGFPALRGLHAVVWHVLGHRLVRVHHAAAEIVAGALDREIAAGVPGPLVEGWRWALAELGDEVFGDLVVVDCVCIRRVGYEDLSYIRNGMGRNSIKGSLSRKLLK